MNIKALMTSLNAVYLVCACPPRTKSHDRSVITTHKNSFRVLALSVLLSAGFSNNALADNDFSTCHEHSSNYENAVLDFALTGDATFDKKSLDFAALLHQFDNLIEERPQDFDPDHLRKLRGALTELEQSVYIVLQILEHADRSYVADRKEQLQNLAKQAHSMLNLAVVLPYSKFRSAFKNNKALKLDIATLQRHLNETTRASENLLIILEKAFRSC